MRAINHTAGAHAMIKVTSLFLCLCVLILVFAPASRGQYTQDIDGKRRAQTGFKFLSMSVSPRAAALADAVTTQGGSSAALFYNPAGMASVEQTVELTLNQAQWIADINYSTGSVAFKPGNGQYGVIGLTVMAVSYGEALETIRANNEEGFIDVGRIEPTATAVGLGYARRLSDRFMVGGHLKYAHQSLGAATVRMDGNSPIRENYALGTVAFDFGVIYETGFRSLVFAATTRNFAPELTYAEESFELPLTLRIGLSVDLIDFTPYSGDMHALLLSIDTATPRDYSEQLKIGGEYRFREILSLRAGYVMPTDQQGINLGTGLRLPIESTTVQADYNYTEFGLFGNVHRVGLRLAF